jgi:phage gp36-like protein
MYAVKQDLIDRFGKDELEAYAWDADLDAVSDTEIDTTLSDATETVNLYIAAITKLPLSTVPAILVSLTADIARYKLQGRNPLDEAKDRYKAAIAMLRDISQGKATLITDAGGVTDGSAIYTQRDEDDRLFTNETLADY